MIACAANYCPDCGDEPASTEIEGRDRDYCSSCDRVWWRQSVPTTSVTVREDDRVLLIRRKGGRDAGRWDLPAGHPEYDEPARAAAARELREETGLAVDPDELELVGTVLSEGPRANYRSINYRTDRAATDGEVEAGSDAADARFVSVESARNGEVDVRKLGRLRLRDAGIFE
ncbi:NUDIX domain-containing protein [Haladaptatus salinisoli]|uniref:NUDIX domain-containing protein n=1 Tax=Haladaptatus salinisoli TaxID=2884876 RepID=UPI001D09F65C|nr:NUDIX domain-containing protein [Haladaptatus salinisoli]